MKKIFILVILTIKFSFSQSIKLEPGTNGYVMVPAVSTLGSCAVAADKGKVVFRTTDNTFYFCNGSSWVSNVISLPFNQSGSQFTSYSGGLFKVTNNEPTGEAVALNGTISGVDGFAIVGTSLNTTPFNTIGVYGENRGTNNVGYGILGSHFGSGIGVGGSTNTGIGVSGFSSSGKGVKGQSSSSGDGVYGSSNTGNGVYGTSTNKGIYGYTTSNTGTGVYGYGENSSGTGVYGLSDGGYGVIGYSLGGGTNAAGGYFTGSSKALITGSGKVGIGLNNPNEILDINGRTRIYHNLNTAGIWMNNSLNGLSTSDGSFFGNKSDTEAGIWIGNNWRWWVNSAGTMFAGTINASSATFTGCVVASNLSCPSDLRFKKNISPITNSLSNLFKIEGVNYQWRRDEFPDKKFSDKSQIGFIAQEIEKIFPEMVATDERGFKSVDYARLTPVLVEAIKELSLKNSKLESRVDKIENLLSLLSVKTE
jgi:Chaperone of endosialidase